MQKDGFGLKILNLKGDSHQETSKINAKGCHLPQLRLYKTLLIRKINRLVEMILK